MKRLPYLSTHLRTLNPQREQRRFWRLYVLALVVLAADYWYIRTAERQFRSHYGPAMRETPSYGIQLEWSSTTDAGISIREVNGHPAFTF